MLENIFLSVILLHYNLCKPTFPELHFCGLLMFLMLMFINASVKLVAFDIRKH